MKYLLMIATASFIATLTGRNIPAMARLVLGGATARDADTFERAPSNGLPICSLPLSSSCNISFASASLASVSSFPFIGAPFCSAIGKSHRGRQERRPSRP